MPDVIGHDKNEGNVETYVTNPFPISDLSIVPKSLRQPTFLLSVCLSATHIFIISHAEKIIDHCVVDALELILFQALVKRLRRMLQAFLEIKGIGREPTSSLVNGV